MPDLVYRGIAFEICDAFAGFPGFYKAIVGTFEGGDRKIINAESFEEMVEIIDKYLDRKSD